MCGIWGYVGLGESQLPADYPIKLNQLSSRGPDGKGIYSFKNVVLGHTRLSINDLEFGQQPIVHNKENIVAVVNGEIYNSNFIIEKARNDLDFAPLSDSDSEAVIAAYLLWGINEMHQHIYGMYSFLLYDIDKNILLASRDHVGIKPLYYMYGTDCIEFASEAKAFALSNGNSRPFPNQSYACINIDSNQPIIIHKYRTKYVLPDHKLYKTENKSLPPECDDMGIDNIMEDFKKTFQASVELRFQSDVPICLFLSGGLDSAVLAVTIRQIEERLGKKIISQAYCIGRKDSIDFKCAKVLADMYDYDLKRVDFEISEAVDLLPTIIYHLESTEPEVIRSSVTNYFLAREASKNFKVALAGEGSDELFGGYLYFNDCPSASHHTAEVARIFKGLNHANLLRVDKMSMAHGLEVRVPYLDQDVIHSVFQIEPKYKLIYPEQDGTLQRDKLPSPFSIEKWILRRAFRDMVPSSILNRAKAGQCEGYSENFTYEFQQRICERYSGMCSQRLSDLNEQEALIYKTIFNTMFNSNLGRHIPKLWEGTCRASNISWPTQFMVNRGLAPKGYLKRGVLIK